MPQTTFDSASTAAAPSASNTTLLQAWQDLQTRLPKIRIRDAAGRLGASELQLLLIDPQSRVQRLRPECGAIMKALEGVGRIMTLTRNDHAVHETRGELRGLDVSENGGMALCLGAIDLRLFLSRWKHACAVDTGSGKDLRRSLQFFDAHGAAAHKVYLTDATDVDAWNALIERFVSDDTPHLQIAGEPAPTIEAENFDREALLAEWAAITDVHQFNQLLKRHGIGRLSAVRAAESIWSEALPGTALEQLLQLASEGQQSLMIFVANPAAVQIHTGAVCKLLRTGPWFNVLDPDFNLHVNTTAINSIWMVRRPSEDGDIHSLECYDAERQLILTVFGERKPGQPELGPWRALLAQLDRGAATASAVTIA